MIRYELACRLRERALESARHACGEYQKTGSLMWQLVGIANIEAARHCHRICWKYKRDRRVSP